MVVPDGVCINSLPCFFPRSSDFVAQCGDPTGTGEGGESSYGQPFKVQCLSVCVGVHTVMLYAVKVIT